MERVARSSRNKHVEAGKLCTKYDAEYMPRVARFMCQRGATMAELATAFSVSNMTIYNWMNNHQEFHDAVQIGVDAFLPRVERALAERAIGFYVVHQERVVDPKTGKVLQKEQRQYFPPDPTCIIFLLKNKIRHVYRDVHNVDVNARVLKTPEQIDEQLRQSLLDLQADGFLKDVTPKQLLAPNNKYARAKRCD